MAIAVNAHQTTPFEEALGAASRALVEIGSRVDIDTQIDISIKLLCGHHRVERLYAWDFDSQGRLKKSIKWAVSRRCENCEKQIQADLNIEAAKQQAEASAAFLAWSHSDEWEILRNNVKRFVLDGISLLDAVEFSTEDPAKQGIIYDRVKGWYRHLQFEAFCGKLRGEDDRPDHERINVCLGQVDAQFRYEELLLLRRALAQ